MKKADSKPRWYYVDEAGDPTFYGKGKRIIIGEEGCSRTFSVGFLRTHDPTQIRNRLAEVRSEVISSKYLASIPSVVNKTVHGFHAKDDCPEVRMMVFEALQKVDFGVQVIVGRKRPNLFKQVHKESDDRFYCDLVSKLFKNQLHLAAENTITFARRGNKSKQHSLRNAVEIGIAEFRKKCANADHTTFHVETNQSRQEPVLQAIDYALWAVQRAFEKSEMRYFNFLRDKFEIVWDVYDSQKYKTGSCVYDRRKNPFHINCVSPLS